MVTGGSQGAQTINAAVAAAAPQLRAAGIQVLHIAGPKNDGRGPAPGTPPYVVLPYVEEMQYAYAAADFVVCRSGAMTCAELTAVGLPAAYVPLPLRGGEQRTNADRSSPAGGGVMVDNADLTPQWIAREVVPRLIDPQRLQTMSAAASLAGARDADLVLARPCSTSSAAAHGRSPMTRPRRPRRRPPRGLGGARRRPGAQRRHRRRAAAGRPRPGAHHGHRRVGMSALARILLERGVAVSGCEARDSLGVRGAAGARRDRPHRPLARATSTTPTRSSTRPRSTRSTRSSWRPATAASRCCAAPPRSRPRSRTGAASRSRAPTARRRPPRC